MLKYISLFSGIGGFELALNELGMECVFASEIDSYARKMYTNHFNHEPHGDITKISSADIPDHDLLVAGFPCQSFSIAGKRGGFEDTRGALFFEIARILKDKKPKYFILENVKGLLSADKGEIWKTICQTLRELGYEIDYKVLNSKDFGLPQNRERIFIVGKYGANVFWHFDWEFGDYPNKVIADILEDNVDEKYYLKNVELADHIQWGGEKHYRKAGYSDISGVNKAGFVKGAKYRNNSEILDTNGNSVTLNTVNPPKVKIQKAGKGEISGIKSEGYIKDGKHRQNSEVVSPEGNTGALNQLIVPKIKIAGYRNDRQTKSFKANKEPKLVKVGKLDPNRNSTSDVYSDQGISPTLTSAMGKGGGHVPKLASKRHSRTGIKSPNMLPEVAQPYRIHEEDGNFSALNTGCHGLVKNDGIRKLTPRECFRVQGFSDDYEIIVSDSQAYKQIGNSVSPPVIKAIGEHLLKDMV